MRFILEPSLSPWLAEALDALAAPEGHHVLHLRTWYPEDPGDPGWPRRIVEKGESESVVVTADIGIYRNPALRKAWLESGLTVVFLKSFGDLPHWEQAARLVKWWPRILDAARRAQKGTGLAVRLNGKIESFEG